MGERSRGGRLLEEPKMMLFKGNTFSLQVSIQDVPRLLWSIKPFTTCQVRCLLSCSAVSSNKYDCYEFMGIKIKTIVSFVASMCMKLSHSPSFFI